MDFPKKQAQRLIPLYLLEYSEKLFTNHPDPEAPWGGGGSDYTAGQGITITNNEISVDTNVIATKEDIPSLQGYATETWVQNQGYSTFSGSYNDLTDKPTIPDTTNFVTTNTNQTITGYKTFSDGFMVGDTTTAGSFVGNAGWGISKVKNDISTDFGAMLTANGEAYFDFSIYSNSAPSNVTVNNTYKLPHQDATGENIYTLATTDDIPAIPTVNNPTIRFTQGGVTKGTITLNQSNDQIIAFDDGAQPDCPFLNVSDPQNQMYFSLDGRESSWYRYVDLSTASHQFYVNLSALNPVFKDGLTSTFNDTTNQLEVSLNAPIPTTATSTSTSTVTPETGTFVTGTSTNTTNVVNSVTYTPSSETLTFTYADNTTASFTFLTSSTTVTSGTTSVVTSVTDSTSNAMTGATVSTSTTTTLS